MEKKFEQLVLDAIDEAGFTDKNAEEDSSENKNIVKHENGDGTVSLSVSFSLDPKVVAEKAKAMKKGIKRDDLSDEITSDDDGDDNDMVYADDQDPEPDPDNREDEDEDPYNGVNVEDSLFQDVLDSIDGEAMDARRSSRHAQTPIENCRAKDPRFCPYHGELAWKGYLEGELQKAGVAALKVNVTNENGTFKVSVDEISKSDVAQVEKALYDLMSINGVKHEQNPVSTFTEVMAGGVVNRGAEGEFKTDWNMRDSVGMLNEWIDDFMTDMVSSGADVDMDDLNGLLEAQEALESFQGSMNSQDPNDVAKFNDLLADAQQKYHSLKAQSDFSQIKNDKDAINEMNGIAKGYLDAQTKFHGDQQGVRDAKMAIFGGNGSFPRKSKSNPVSFQDSHPWAKKYNLVASGLGRAESDFVKAGAELSKALNDYQQGTINIKQLRTALSSYQYQAENFETRAETYPKAKTQFMQEFYDWAQSEHNPNLAAAFPNGRP